MNQRVVPAPSLTPVAAPVSRYVTPVYQYAPQTNGWLQAAEALQTLNPALNRFLDNRYADMAATSEAEGALAEQQIDASVQFGQGRDAWRQFVTNVRSDNPEAAANLEGANPHFRRGLIRNRMNRIGMGLGDYLQTQYRNNEGGVQSLSGAEVEAWATEQINAQASQLGIAQMDPVLLAEVFLPHTQRAARAMVGYAEQQRSRRARRDYEAELSASVGMLLSGGDTGESPPSMFLDQFNGANWPAATETEGGPRLSFGGLMEVDEAIDTSGLAATGLPRDGLRTVVAEEGIEPVLSWGAMGAPADHPIGTRVREATSPAPRIQAMLDNAIADGMNPREANAAIVDSVITEAMASGNVDVLRVLDEVRTPYGPLSSIQRHRQEILEAQYDIEDRNFRMEERSRRIEEQETAQRRSGYDVQASRLIASDPLDPAVDELINEMRDAGFADLAREMENYRETVLDRELEVRTNHGVVTDIRHAISTGEMTDDELRRRIRLAQANGDFPSSVANSLYDDVDNRSRYQDAFADRQVQSVISDFERVVSERFTRDGILERIPGTETSILARFEFEANITDFVAENPEATVSEVRAYARDEAARLLSSETWRPTAREIDDGANRGFGTEVQAAPQVDVESTASTPNPTTDPSIIAVTIRQLPGWIAQMRENPAEGFPEGAAEAINQTARALGITAQQLIEQYGY